MANYLPTVFTYKLNFAAEPVAQVQRNNLKTKTKNTLIKKSIH